MKVLTQLRNTYEKKSEKIKQFGIRSDMNLVKKAIDSHKYQENKDICLNVKEEPQRMMYPAYSDTNLNVPMFDTF